MIRTEHFVERVSFRPKSYNLSRHKCVECGSSFYSGYKHRWGRVWNIFGLEFHVTEGENPYCEDCAPGLVSESFTEGRFGRQQGGDIR